MTNTESFPPSPLPNVAICRENGETDGDGGNRTHATFPPSPTQETPANAEVFA